MKYIMMEVKTGEINRNLPIIFPDFLVHQDVADALRGVPQLRMSRPVAAGFITRGDVMCSGGSETLKLASRKEDEQIIDTMDYLHGITA